MPPPPPPPPPPAPQFPPAPKRTLPLAASASPAPPKEVDPAEVGSPHELVGWVDSVLVKLEAKFDGMSEEVLGRMDTLGTRIDSLERSLAELMEGTAGGPDAVTSPVPKDEA